VVRGDTYRDIEVQTDEDSDRRIGKKQHPGTTSCVPTNRAFAATPSIALNALRYRDQHEYGDIE